MSWYGKIPWRIGKGSQSYELQLGWFIFQLLWPWKEEPYVDQPWRIRIDVVSYDQRRHYVEITLYPPNVRAFYRHTIRSSNYSIKAWIYYIRKFLLPITVH
jgi:hypothetical protein